MDRKKSLIGPYKHELKYIINTFDHISLAKKLEHLMRFDGNTDPSGNYSVRSLYFDDVFNTALFEKISGSLYRSKFRIRVYNLSDTVIKLEKKIKNGPLSRKVVRGLSRNEYDLIRFGDIRSLSEKGDGVISEFCSRYHGDGLRPRVLVDYKRQAFVSDAENIRVTFDTRLASGLGSTNLFSREIPMTPMLEPGYVVMEVKFHNYFPDNIKNVLQLTGRPRLSLSKYAVCMKTQKRNNWEDN